RSTAGLGRLHRSGIRACKSDAGGSSTVVACRSASLSRIDSECSPTISTLTTHVPAGSALLPAIAQCESDETRDDDDLPGCIMRIPPPRFRPVPALALLLGLLTSPASAQSPADRQSLSALDSALAARSPAELTELLDAPEARAGSAPLALVRR